MTLPIDAAARKALPIVSGCVDYFAAALEHLDALEVHVTPAAHVNVLVCLARRGQTDGAGFRWSADLARHALVTLQRELGGERDSGCFLTRFADALAAVADLSVQGNQQHNPGEPLHWARGKSGDEADAFLRHWIERGTIDTDGKRHATKAAWRALANLQKELERDLGLPISRGSRV